MLHVLQTTTNNRDIICCMSYKQQTIRLFCLCVLITISINIISSIFIFIIIIIIIIIIISYNNSYY